MVGQNAQLPSVPWEDASVICAPFYSTGAHTFLPGIQFCALNELQGLATTLLEADTQYLIKSTQEILVSLQPA